MSSFVETRIEAADRMAAIRTVAVIGVGSMGKPMAHHIREAGFELTVCDRNAETLKEFEGLGVRVTASAADCAGCDAVIVLVATVKQLNDVAGAIAGAGKEPRYLVVMSTVSPQDMQAVAGVFADAATRVVDAPISGGVMAARKAALTVLVGGSEDDLNALNALFAAFGKNVFLCGDLGAGQTVKVVNNMIAIGNQLISAEAYSFGLASGLKLDRLIPALEAGSARNFLSKDGADGPREAFRAWSETEDLHQAIKTISLKDLDLALSLFPDGIAHPAVTAVRNALAGAGDETLANWRRVAGS